MNSINIHRGTFLEKEELRRMIGFLENSPTVTSVIAGSISFGLVSPGSKRGTPFRVTVSSTAGTVNMVGGYVIGPDLQAYKVENQTDLPVPNDDKWYWLKVSPFTRNFENGYVQVDTFGNVSGTVNFEGIVRGQSSGVPTCIKFVKDDGTTLLNNYVYQIVDIINANNIVLSSGYPFTAETQLRVVILGSIPMGQRFTDEQLEGLYTFTDGQLVFVPETSPGTVPPKKSNEYYVARLKNINGTVTVLEERDEFWNLGGSSVGGFFTFEIEAIPSDSKVLIDGIPSHGGLFPDGYTLSYEVSHENYVTKTGSYTIQGKDMILHIELEAAGPVEKYNVQVRTQNGSMTEGGVSINDPSTYKANETMQVNRGDTVNLYTSSAGGFKLTGWFTASGELIEAVNPLPVIVFGNIDYVAHFEVSTDDDYWDFLVREQGATDIYEVLEVPTQDGSATEGVMVKIE